MPKNVQLEVVWDGPIQSLEEHRISLSLFAQPLENLLSAARRIASSMVNDATEDVTVGRLSNVARQIDIEIGSVVEGSSGIQALLTFKGEDPQFALFNDIAENVGIALLEAIESESRSRLKNYSVRKYLSSLPRELTAQRYNLHENGRPIKRVEIGKVHLAECPPTIPFVVEMQGRVIGVGFDPGKPEVRLKGQDAPLTVSATEEQVDKALALRRVDVRAIVLRHGTMARLLRIEKSSIPMDLGDREEIVYRKWDGLLRRLAL